MERRDSTPTREHTYRTTHVASTIGGFGVPVLAGAVGNDFSSLSDLSLMIATVARIECQPLTTDLAAYSTELGRSQMAHFLIDALAQPIMPVAWVGGLEGGVTQISRQPSIHSFDLAQMLGLHMGRVEKQILQTKKQLEVFVGLADTVELVTAEIDLWLMNALLQGSYSACLEHGSGRSAGDAKVHVERLLSGSRFQLNGPIHQAQVPYSAH